MIFSKEGSLHPFISSTLVPYGSQRPLVWTAGWNYLATVSDRCWRCAYFPPPLLLASPARAKSKPIKRDFAKRMWGLVIRDTIEHVSRYVLVSCGSDYWIDSSWIEFVWTKFVYGEETRNNFKIIQKVPLIGRLILWERGIIIRNNVVIRPDILFHPFLVLGD